MLVALDTAQLIALANPRSDKGVVREFRETWEDRACVLALNETTLREFISGDGSGTESREAFLLSFSSIKGVPHPNFLYEAEFAAHALAIAVDEPVDSYERNIIPQLRERLFRDIHIESLAELVKGTRSQALKRREFDELAAGGLDLIRELGPAWPPKLLVEMSRHEAIAKYEEFVSQTPEPMRSHLLERRALELDTYYRDPSDRRGFMAVVTGISDLIVARTAPFEDFHEIAHIRERWFNSRTRGLLVQRGVVNGEGERTLVLKLSPYRMPGVSVRMAKLREQQRDRVRKVIASDVADDISLMFAPYTDLTCVDKRVFRWIELARSGNQADLLFPRTGTNLIDARSLERVAEAIRTY